MMDYDALHLQATNFMEEGRFFSALNLYEQLLNVDPNNIKNLFSYSQALIMTGKDDEKALSTIEKALSMDKDNAECLSLYGVILQHLNKKDPNPE